MERDGANQLDAGFQEEGAEREVRGKIHDLQDLHDFIEGSTLLATGGGGAKQIAFNLLYNSGIRQLRTVTIDGVEDTAEAAMVAQVFAPTALWACQDYRSALHSFQQSVGCGIVFPGEAGAVNGIVPAIVASLTGSVLLQASTSDRSLPELDMTLFQNRVPLAQVDIVGPEEVPRCSHDFGKETDAIKAEDFILGVMKDYEKEFQGVGGFAAYLMRGADLKSLGAEGLLFENTFDYGIELGRVMRQQGTLSAVLDTLDRHLGPSYSPYSLFEGYLVETGVHPHAQDYGYADFASADPRSALGLRIYSSNENMIAWATMIVLVRGVPTPLELFPVAIGPDAITYLLLEGDSPKGYQAGFSFSNEAFDPDYGDPEFFKTHRMAIIGIPEPRLRRQDIIASFRREITRAMDSFGRTYTHDYVPIEDLPKLGLEFDIIKPEEPGSEQRISIPEDKAGCWQLLDGDGWRELLPNDIKQGAAALPVGKKLRYTPRRQDAAKTMTFTWPSREQVIP